MPASAIGCRLTPKILLQLGQHKASARRFFRLGPSARMVSKLIAFIDWSQCGQIPVDILTPPTFSSQVLALKSNA